MYMQQNVAQYNVGDVVERSDSKSDKADRGTIAGYSFLRFSISKAMNSLNLTPGLYMVANGLLVNWGSREAQAVSALDVILVKPEYSHKPRLSKARIEALTTPTRIGDLPVLPVEIGDWVSYGEFNQAMAMVTDIDYIAAIENDLRTGKPRSSVTLFSFTENKHITVPIGEVKLRRQGAVWGYYESKGPDFFYSFAHRYEYEVFKETTGVILDQDESFAKNGPQPAHIRFDESPVEVAA